MSEEAMYYIKELDKRITELEKKLDDFLFNDDYVHKLINERLNKLKEGLK